MTKPEQGGRPAPRVQLIESRSKSDEVGRPLNRTQSNLPALIDVETLACHLGVTVHHVRRLVQERRIPHLKVGAFVRFDPREVASWLEERRVPEYRKRQARLSEPV